MTTCPACQRDLQYDRSDCPFCGVVFAKWKGRAATGSANPALSRARLMGAAVRHGDNSLGKGLLIGCVAAWALAFVSPIIVPSITNALYPVAAILTMMVVVQEVWLGRKVKRDAFKGIQDVANEFGGRYVTRRFFFRDHPACTFSHNGRTYVLSVHRTIGDDTLPSDDFSSFSLTCEMAGPFRAVIETSDRNTVASSTQLVPLDFPELDQFCIRADMEAPVKAWLRNGAIQDIICTLAREHSGVWLNIDERGVTVGIEGREYVEKTRQLVPQLDLLAESLSKLKLQGAPPQPKSTSRTFQLVAINILAALAAVFSFYLFWHMPEENPGPLWGRAILIGFLAVLMWFLAWTVLATLIMDRLTPKKLGMLVLIVAPMLALLFWDGNGNRSVEKPKSGPDEEISRTDKENSNTPNIQTVYYVISGSTEGDLRAELKAKAPVAVDGNKNDALTKWTFRWTWPGFGMGSCDLEKATVASEITIILPRWEPPAEAAPTLVAKWKDFAGALAERENSHAELVAGHRAAILSAIKNATCETANEVARTASNLAKQHIDEYDAARRPGLAQSTRF